MKPLGFKLLVFLCKQCLNRGINKWRNKDDDGETKRMQQQNIQTENLMKEAETQREKSEDQQQVVEVARMKK
ncbi:hypothetical protein E2C01_048194 [Portunus trituberculatus]|uniref:Uncharacterized protein n=1 Tax=Portunus trituberculatus TaxID=210409 RepID=A0A5B7GCL3_PORTR|nr:hypothetical protein [Portunus trituberculatus]